MTTIKPRLLHWFDDWRRWWAGHRGSNIVFVAIAMTAVMAMTALVVDGGFAYGEKRQVQNAADAASLAGMRVYWIDKYANESVRRTAAQNAACDYARLNGADTCTATFLNATSGGHTEGASPNCPSLYILKVTTARTFKTFFAGSVGRSQLAVSASSKAQVQGLTGTSGLWPVAVKKTTFNIPSCYASDGCGNSSCTEYEIWNSTKEASGNAGWLNWNREGQVPNFICPNTGTPNLICELNNPNSSGYWRVGDWVPGNPGLKDASGVRDAIDSWMCRHVTVPVYDTLTGTGDSTKYHIVGFAEFVLTSYSMTGNPKTVKGKFVRWADTGESNYDDCADFNYECQVHLVP